MEVGRPSLRVALQRWDLLFSLRRTSIIQSRIAKLHNFLLGCSEVSRRFFPRLLLIRLSFDCKLHFIYLFTKLQQYSNDFLHHKWLPQVISLASLIQAFPKILVPYLLAQKHLRNDSDFNLN